MSGRPLHIVTSFSLVGITDDRPQFGMLVNRWELMGVNVSPENHQTAHSSWVPHIPVDFFCLHLTREEGCPGTDGSGESKADSCRVCNAEEERNPEGGSSFFCPIDFGVLEPLKHLKPTMVEISHC